MVLKKKPPDPNYIERRKMLNRISASASRRKKAKLIDDLYMRNAQLEAENAMLRRKLLEMTIANGNSTEKDGEEIEILLTVLEYKDAGLPPRDL